MKNELLKLKNVGPAVYEDLQVLRIDHIAQLAQADADELYTRLQTLTGKQHDPCVWDVFAVIIHEAKTGEKQPWWQWSTIRKQRQQQGEFCSMPIKPTKS